jgi:hypothetical protein
VPGAGQLPGEQAEPRAQPPDRFVPDGRRALTDGDQHGPGPGRRPGRFEGPEHGQVAGDRAGVIRRFAAGPGLAVQGPAERRHPSGLVGGAHLVQQARQQRPHRRLVHQGRGHRDPGRGQRQPQGRAPAHPGHHRALAERCQRADLGGQVTVARPVRGHHVKIAEQRHHPAPHPAGGGGPVDQHDPPRHRSRTFGGFRLLGTHQARLRNFGRSRCPRSPSAPGTAPASTSGTRTTAPAGRPCRRYESRVQPG